MQSLSHFSSFGLILAFSIWTLLKWMEYDTGEIGDEMNATEKSEKDDYEIVDNNTDWYDFFDYSDEKTE